MTTDDHLAQGTVDFRREERLHALGHYPERSTSMAEQPAPRRDKQGPAPTKIAIIVEIEDPESEDPEHAMGITNAAYARIASESLSWLGSVTGVVRESRN